MERILINKVEKTVKDYFAAILHTLADLEEEEYKITDRVVYDHRSGVTVEKISYRPDYLFCCTQPGFALFLHLSDGRCVAAEDVPFKDFGVFDIILLSLVCRKQEKEGITEEDDEDLNEEDLKYPEFNEYDVLAEKGWDPCNLTLTQYLQVYDKVSEYWEKVIEYKKKIIK